MRIVKTLFVPSIAVAGAVSTLVASHASAATLQASNSAQLYTGNSPSVSNSGGTFYIGDYGDGAPHFSGEVAFQLPDLGVQSDPFTSATLALTVNGSQNNNSYGYQESHTVALTQSGAPLTRASGDITVADIGAAGTDVGPTIGYSDHTDLGTYSSGDISSFLNDGYAGGTGVGQYVFFQVQAAGGLIYYKGFNIAGSNDPVSAPQITFTAHAASATPEPASLCGLVVLAGGAMARRRRN